MLDKLVDIIIVIFLFAALGITVTCILPILIIVGICFLIYLFIEYSLLFIDKHINKTDKNEEA